VSQLSIQYVEPGQVVGARSLRVLRVARISYPVGVGLLAALYYGAARLGFELNFAGPVAAIVWLPVGIAIAFLYLGGYRYWPGVLIGDLFTNNAAALHGWAGLGTTCGNVAEVLVATYVIKRLVGQGSPLGSARGIGAIVSGIAAGVTVSATVGSLALLPSNVAMAHEIPTIWRTWWLGDFTGALVVVPFALAWWAPLPGRLRTGRLVEAGLLLAATVSLAELAFRSHRPLTYLVFPALIWAALRFGERGATFAVTLVAGLAILNTTHYLGPFVFNSVSRSVLSTQLFIAAAALTTLCLAAVVAERRRFAAGLEASLARLIVAGDSERRRLERNLHDGAQQRLTMLAYRLREATELAAGAPDRAAALMGEAESELQVAIDELRVLAQGIHPAALTDFGFSQAVAGLAAQSPVRIEIGELPAGRLDEIVEAAAYYVVTEALTNARKHAGATSIQVRATAGRGLLRVEVRDDGRGGADESNGSGLQGLRDRVEALGGTFRLESPPGRGTRVAAAIPLPGPA
jgi:signal transduction histidine kinase